MLNTVQTVWCSCSVFGTSERLFGTVPGTWWSIPGTWVPGTMDLGARYLVPDIRYQYLVPGTWHPVPGTRYQVPGYQVPVRFLVPERFPGESKHLFRVFERLFVFGEHCSGSAQTITTPSSSGGCYCSLAVTKANPEPRRTCPKHRWQQPTRKRCDRHLVQGAP
jgi:hypothetical protein